MKREGKSVKREGKREKREGKKVEEKKNLRGDLKVDLFRAPKRFIILLNPKISSKFAKIQKPLKYTCF